MKRLRHPNILLFMGAVMSPERLCIVTEFLPRYLLFAFTIYCSGWQCALIHLFHFVQWKFVPSIAEERIEVRLEKACKHGFGYSKYHLSNGFLHFTLLSA